MDVKAFPPDDIDLTSFVFRVAQPVSFESARNNKQKACVVARWYQNNTNIQHITVFFKGISCIIAQNYTYFSVSVVQKTLLQHLHLR